MDIDRYNERKQELLNAVQRLFAPLVLRAAGGATQTGRADAGCGDRQYPGAYLAQNIANERVHGTTQIRPAQRLPEECLQPLPAPWRGDIRAARPQREEEVQIAERPVVVVERIAQASPLQHPLAIYEQLLDQIRDTQGVTA